MQHLYIDESGSMTSQYTKSWPYFIISIIRVDSPDKLRRLHKRFCTKHMEELRRIDSDQRMFKNGDFQELKGSSFTPDLKREFVSYFGRRGTIDIYYIVIDNRKVSGGLYANTARAFNYVLKLALEYFIRNSILPDDKYIIQLDERNERSDTRHFLQNYLNTELLMENVLSNDIEVNYFDSSNNRIIQIADVFANLYFSNLMTGNYQDEIKLIKDNGCLKAVFRFPL